MSDILTNLAFLGFGCVKNLLPKGKKKEEFGLFFGWEFNVCSIFPPQAGVQCGRK